jgi:hypothetical protein
MIKLKFHTRLFIEWLIIAGITIFIQLTYPFNLGLLIAILMVPVFIHDIILNYCKK